MALAFWILAAALVLTGGASLAVLALTGATAGKVQPAPSAVVAGLVAVGGWTNFLALMAGLGLLWPVVGFEAARRDTNETFGRYFAVLLLLALGGAGLFAVMLGLMARFAPATPGAQEMGPLLLGVLAIGVLTGPAFFATWCFAVFGRREHLRRRHATR